MNLMHRVLIRRRSAIRFLSRPLCSAAILLVATGCGNDSSVSRREALLTDAQSSVGNPLASPAAPTEAAASPAERGVAGSSAMGRSASLPTGQQDTATSVPSMIIRNGTASIQVDSLEIGIAAVQRLAASLGGYVGNTSLSSGDFQVRSATLELKLPSARFDSALSGLAPIGKVESVNSTAEDVGEEFVDISARVANAKRLEERLVVLLATRAGKLEDVLAVERELARVREDIERYEGRIRYLKTRVAISTLSVTVHERAPLVSAQPGENVLLEAFKDAWRNGVRFIAWGISMLGIVIPLVALVTLLVFVWRRVRRRSRPE